jgi:hypothetical protein
VRFARGDAAPKNVNWPFVKGSESFEALMNYSFDRTWDALPSAATFTVQRAASRVREVHVTPHEDLTFLLVRPEFVEPLDWKVLQRVQLTLEYTDRAGNSARKVFDYTEAQNGPYEWRLRVHEKNAAPEYRWSLRFFRRGRTEAAVTIDAQTASGVTLPLPNPFAPRHVVVRLGRAVKIADFDLITVELTYGDPKSRPVTASMTFDESNAAPQKWTLAVPEDGPNEYRWRAVFFRDGQESETAGTAKFAGPTSLLLLNAPE